MMKLSTSLFLNAATIILSFMFFALTKQPLALTGILFVGASLVSHAFDQQNKGN